MSKHSKIVYTPQGRVIEGYRGFFLTTRLMWQELLSARELIWRLFLRDLTAKYRQSALGITWVVLMPAMAVGMFVLMNNTGILILQNVGIPYPLYALIGLSIWSLFSTGLSACTTSLINAGSMIVKINFPKVALVIAASGQAIVEFLVRMLLMTAVFLYYGIIPSWLQLFWGFMCLIPLYLLTLGMGFLTALLTSVLRDLFNIISIGLIGMMLLTPVLYPIAGNTILARMNRWNPFNYLVNVPRDLIIKGQSDLQSKFMWVVIFSVVVFYIGWKIFYLAQTKIAERL